MLAARNVKSTAKPRLGVVKVTTTGAKVPGVNDGIFTTAFIGVPTTFSDCKPLPALTWSTATEPEPLNTAKETIPPGNRSPSVTVVVGVQTFPPGVGVGVAVGVEVGVAIGVAVGVGVGVVVGVGVGVVVGVGVGLGVGVAVGVEVGVAVGVGVEVGVGVGTISLSTTVKIAAPCVPMVAPIGIDNVRLMVSFVSVKASSQMVTLKV